jgi:hypothetical protein
MLPNMPEAFLIGVDTEALDRSNRRLFLVMTDTPERAVDAVRRLWPTSKVAWNGITALPDTATKLGLRPDEPRQL